MGDAVIRHLFISVSQQRLFFFRHRHCEKSFSISTAKNGVGELAGSYCTPRGWHAVADIIGLDAPMNTVFKSRQATGQVYHDALAQQFPDQDWILSRIIRLAGKEMSFNQGSQCDTYNRFIYIHGCADNALLGVPASHGCIRMANQDVIQLATLIFSEDSVFIG
jgi:hypothetical protein